MCDRRDGGCLPVWQPHDPFGHSVYGLRGLLAALRQHGQPVLRRASCSRRGHRPENIGPAAAHSILDAQGMCRGDVSPRDNGRPRHSCHVRMVGASHRHLHRGGGMALQQWRDPTDAHPSQPTGGILPLRPCMRDLLLSRADDT